MAVSRSRVPSSPPSRNRWAWADASFDEKSVWIQLASVVVGLGAYFVVAGRMLFDGIEVLAAYMPLFALAVVLIVAVNVAGHIVAAIASRPEGRDERDRLITWRAESNSSWILGVGVIVAIIGLVVPVGEVWVAHLLLLALVAAEVAKDVNQLVYYRRGV
jgi:uncharacterized membrane protein HdeD (DUF308 family)